MRRLSRTIQPPALAEFSAHRRRASRMNEYEYSSTGLALTRSFEGLRLTAYQDSAGVWTIGYGHTGPEVHRGQCISEIEAEALLRSDLTCAVRAVRKSVQVALAQHQFDALVDFCFNVGHGSFL